MPKNRDTSGAGRAAKLLRLRGLDEEARGLRKALGLARPGALVWEATVDFDEKLIVEADGYGGGTLMRVTECGGRDRFVYESVFYPDVADAVAEAGRRTGAGGGDDEGDDEGEGGRD